MGPKEITKTYNLYKKSNEIWNELPLWLKIFVPLGLLYILSKRKGPIGDITKVAVFTILWMIGFLVFLIYWLLYTYYVYIPFFLIIVGVGSFAWFFTVIYYRRQKGLIKEQCMDELREKYDIEDVEEEIIEVGPKSVKAKIYSYEVFRRRKKYIDIEFKCGNCGARHSYKDRRLTEKQFWIQCTNCGAFNLFDLEIMEGDDGARIISTRDKRNWIDKDKDEDEDEGVNVLW